MRRVRLLAPGAVVAASLLATAAAEAVPQTAEAVPQAAQPACKPWREVAQYLGERYAERPVAVGLQADGSLLQVYAAPTTDTWTMVSMRPDGMACLIGAGKAWEQLARPNTDPAA